MDVGNSEFERVSFLLLFAFLSLIESAVSLESSASIFRSAEMAETLASQWIRPVYQKTAESDRPSADDARGDSPHSRSPKARNGPPVNQDPPLKKAKTDSEVMALTTRTGGAYIPPARLRAMQAQITDKNRLVQKLSFSSTSFN